MPDGDIDDEPARALAREIASRSITHVGPPLPRFDGDIRVSSFKPSRVSPAEELSDPVATLERALRKHFGGRLHFARDGGTPDGGGPVIACTFNAFFDETQARALPALLGDRGVLCALRSPYDATLARHNAVLLTYCDVPVSLEALAAVLAGERKPTGQLPVSMP